MDVQKFYLSSESWKFGDLYIFDLILSAQTYISVLKMAKIFCQIIS